jgi:hypothetical protein
VSGVGLPPPDPETWRGRADWFARAIAANAGPAAPPFDERAERLLGELEAAFCAGAWAACVMLAFAIAEQAARKRDDGDPEFDLLRERRNALAHGNSGALPSDAELEDQAQAAIRISLRALAEAAWR